MDVNTINGARATDRGTKIMKPGNEMDKNAFLRILTAELSNQDPMNTKDSTQYVTQLAQFTSLEQMTNLNTTMTMSAASSLMGKGVTLKVSDAEGNFYTGIVKGVSKQYGQIKLGVEVINNGVNEIREFSYDEVSEVWDIEL